MNSTEPNRERPTVLIVDDEPGILRAIQRTLRREGYNVETAEGGRAAIAFLERNPIDVIVCDQRMPDVAGPEVLAKAYEHHPDAFRITLTGYTDLEAAQKSINEGRVNQFLMKPWNDDHLKRCVADGVRAHRLIIENRELEAQVREQNAKLEAWNQELEQAVKDRTRKLEAQNAQLDKLVQFFQSMLRDTVGVLAAMLEMASPALGIHCKRVSGLAKQLGQHLGVDENMIRDLELAAWLHDLGKMASLTRQNAADTPQATGRDTRVNVSEAGYHILSRIGGFKRIAEGVRYQSEKYDGSGGPKRMRGEAIPLVSRVIAIVDAYDNAVYAGSDPSKPDHAAAEKLLQRNAGRAFDPKLVRAFLDSLRAAASEAPSEVEVEISPRQARPGMTLARDLVNSDKVLLAKQGTKLTEAMVQKIRDMASGDCILSTLSVMVPQLPEETPTNARAA